MSLLAVREGMDQFLQPLPVRRNTGARLFVQAMLARAYVRIVGSLREPAWMLSDAIFPNLGMCAFVLLYRALGAPRSYEALAVIGGVLTTYWINVVWGMGAQLYWEKQQGQLQLYFAAPCSRLRFSGAPGMFRPSSQNSISKVFFIARS